MTKQESQQPCGLILCGGRSRRMGVDKANLKFGESTLLQTVCNHVTAVASPVVVMASGEQSLPALNRDVTIARDTASFPGPLPAMLAGFQRLQEIKNEKEPHHHRPLCIWVTACDTPFVTGQMIESVHQTLMESTAEAVTMTVHGRWNPLLSCYRIHGEQLASAVRRGVCRATDFLQSLNVLEVDADSFREPGSEICPAVNLNSVEDVQNVVRQLEDARLNPKHHRVSKPSG